MEMAHRRWDLGEKCYSIYADFLKRGERDHKGRLLGKAKQYKVTDVFMGRKGKLTYKKTINRWPPWTTGAWRIMQQVRDMGLEDPRQPHPGTMEPLEDTRSTASA